jgi:uncharacterized protein YcfJ
MKNVIAITAALILSATIAQANRIQGTVVGMQETYRDVIKEVPIQSCQNVEVPIYETRRTGGGGTADTLVGALIGGAIGNQFGNGNGKDAMTVLGAIVGADKANKNGGREETVIVGYRQQRQCSTTYSQQATQVRGDNVVTIDINGQQVNISTQQWYKKGTIVYLNVGL